MEQKIKNGQLVYINCGALNNLKGKVVGFDRDNGLYEVYTIICDTKNTFLLTEETISIEKKGFADSNKEIILDHDVRLESLLLVKGLPRSVEAYIKEYLLNKDFKAMVESIKSDEP